MAIGIARTKPKIQNRFLSDLAYRTENK